MKVSVLENKSNITDEDVRWFLIDEQLWITKFSEYSQIEEIIRSSVGSFNTIYDINDTLLFNKTSGEFHTSIIRLNSKIKVDSSDEFFIEKVIKKGNLHLDEMNNQSYLFPETVIYSQNCDYLFSLSVEFIQKTCDLILVSNDFGFFVFNDELIGWMLKNAHNHIYINDTLVTVEKDVLADYLKAVRHLDNNDKSELFKMVERDDLKGKPQYKMLIEAIKDICDWY